MKIAFIWIGLNGRYGKWKDGLWAAMKLIEKTDEVVYFDIDELDMLREFNPDVVLFWESPVALKGPYAEQYKQVIQLPYPKALLFSGGPVEAHTCYGFDLYFVESKVNEEEFEALGLPWKRAFGVNTQIMKPMRLTKKRNGILHATFADWKRHTLFAEALGQDGLAVGRVQDHDRNGYNRCKELGVEIMDEQAPERVAELINQSHAVVNTSSMWGGGQRCTLEAMACGVPVIVMKDSPKNIEFVEASGGGVICEPTVEGIQEALEVATDYQGELGRHYVNKNWTERHYADALLEGIKQIV